MKKSLDGEVTLLLHTLRENHVGKKLITVNRCEQTRPFRKRL